MRAGRARFFGKPPPNFKPRLETLRIVLAYNPPCASYRPASRRIGRNKSGSIPAVSIAQNTAVTPHRRGGSAIDWT